MYLEVSVKNWWGKRVTKKIDKVETIQIWGQRPVNPFDLFGMPTELQPQLLMSTPEKMVSERGPNMFIGQEPKLLGMQVLIHKLEGKKHWFSQEHVLETWDQSVNRILEICVGDDIRWRLKEPPGL